MGEVLLRSVPYPNHSAVQVASLATTRSLRWLLEDNLAGTYILE